MNGLDMDETDYKGIKAIIKQGATLDEVMKGKGESNKSETNITKSAHKIDVIIGLMKEYNAYSNNYGNFTLKCYSDTILYRYRNNRLISDSFLSLYLFISNMLLSVVRLTPNCLK